MGLRAGGADDVAVEAPLDERRVTGCAAVVPPTAGCPDPIDAWSSGRPACEDRPAGAARVMAVAVAVAIAGGLLGVLTG